MASNLRALRRRILTPSNSATTIEKRGFHDKGPQARQLLEQIGATFLTGYGHAVEARAPADVVAPLEGIRPRLRGFAYEGAAMGFTMLDALPFTRGDRLARHLAGRGDDHIYMSLVGIGWAMARLPRFRWPDITAFDPLLRWLILDGYGFHQAFFHTDRYVHRRFDDPGFAWPDDGRSRYAHRAIDQGIGRALWFVGGADPDVTAGHIDSFPAARHPDMFAGAGLAAAYAGGADESELLRLWERAGPHRRQVAQGCAFAAESRVRAGLVAPHTELATRTFCDMTPEQAARLTIDLRSDLPLSGDLPAYEIWRQRIADQIASLRRC